METRHIFALLLCVWLFVCIGKQFVHEIISDHKTIDKNYVNTDLLRRKREIRDADHTENITQTSTGGPSLLQTFYSHNVDDMQGEPGDGEPFLETVPDMYVNRTTEQMALDRPQRDVDTVCVNPIVSKVDECIESMNKKVAEKCLPGLNKMLDQLQKAYEETKEGPYSIQAKESEVCLRDVFSDCTYESRFKIKTKIKQLIGINLDIAFQEEFEMDCCDKEFMNEVISNVKECFEKLNYETPEVGGSPEEISTELLKTTGKCIEDHTAFTCVLQTTELFKDTMREIIYILRNETLELLRKIGEEKYPHGRLCLKWIDYDRLEKCEPDFFDYVLCLKNGTHVDGLYEKVVDCFQNALRVCPPSTVKLIITITAGAIEGHGGKEPEFKEALAPLPTMWPPTTVSPCDNSVRQRWLRETEGCANHRRTTRDSPEKHEGPLVPFSRCFKKHRPAVCRFHKASEFSDIAGDVNDILLRIVPEGKMKTCVEGLKSPKMKQCLASLFLYYVSIHHAHYTKEARNKILAKAKLCFKVNLRDCSKKYIDDLIRIYLVIQNVGLPKIDESLFITRVTFPEGVIWCETRIISSEYPVPPTEKFTIPPEFPTEVETFTPTTVQFTRYPLPPRTTVYRPSPIRTVTYIFTVPPQTFTGEITPTTIREEVVTPPSLTKIETRPPRPTRFTFFPPPMRTFEEEMTPTTIKMYTITIPTRQTRQTVPPGGTRTYFFTVPPRTFSRRITPTTIRPFTVTFPTLSFRETRTVPTRIFTLPPRSTRYTKIYPFSTKVYTFPKPSERFTVTLPPPRPSIFTITPPSKLWTAFTTPQRTSTKVTRLPVPTYTEEQAYTCTTVIRFQIKEEIVPTWSKEIRPTTEVFTIKPPEVQTEEVVTPTTIEIEILTPPEITPTRYIPKPPTKEFTFPPQPTYRTKIITPTTYSPLEITFTVPPIRITRPTPITHKEIYTPHTHGWKHTRPRTTARTITFPITKTTRIEKREETTIRVRIIEEHETKIKEHTKGTPPTKMITYFPPVITRTQPYKPSTVIWQTVTLGDCLSDMKPGPCTARIPRWFYNRKTNECEKFIYGGCEGNANNFETKEECESVCKAQTGPPIRTEVITIRPPGCIITVTIPPTTSQYITQTIPPGTKRETFTLPTVEIITRTPEERTVTEYVPPTKHHTWEIPIPPKTFFMTMLPRPTWKHTWVPPTRTKWQTFPPTTVKTVTFPVKPTTYSMAESPTTMRIQIIEKQKETVTGSRPPRVTCIITITPTGRIITEFITPPTVGETRFPIQTKEERFTPPSVKTTRFILTPQPWTYTGYITPPTIRWETQTIPPFRFTIEEKPKTTEIKTRTPRTVSWSMEKFPTTSRVITVPVTPATFTEKGLGTTIRIRILEEQGFSEEEEYSPETEEYVFPPEEHTEFGQLTRTPIEFITEIIPTRTRWERRTPPGTAQITFTPKEITGFSMIRPTTYSEFEIPHTERQEKTFPPPKTSVFTYPPKEISMEEIITPSTTKIWTQTPKPRPTYKFSWPTRPPLTKIWTETPMTWGTRYSVTPETQTYPASPEEYYCEYPTPPSTTICEWIPICPPGAEVIWREKILNCTLASLGNKGKTLYQIIIQDKNMNGLQNLVTSCIRRIGDTACRNTTFPLGEWMMDKVITIVGEYGEHADEMDVINDELYQDMKKCIIMLDESRLEKCFPGLYKALTDIILYEKPTEMLDVNQRKHRQCLPEAFRHCNRFATEKIEEKLENIFGACIKITRPQGKTGCKGVVFGHKGPQGFKREENVCSSHEFEEILAQMQDCVNKEVKKAHQQNKKLTFGRIMNILIKCKEEQPCVIRSTQLAELLMKFVLINIAENIDFKGKPRKDQFQEKTVPCEPLCWKTGGSCPQLHVRTGVCECPGNQEFSEDTGCISNRCLENVNSKKFKQCLKSVEGALPNVDQLQNPEKLVELIVNCIAKTLKHCSAAEIQKLLQFFVRMICTKCKVPELPDIGEFHTIASVSVTPKGVGVCSNVFRTDEDSQPSRPTIQDDCVPIDDGNQTIQIRVPACKENKINRWLSEVKECVESKVTNIGLRNPDYLTLEKVIFMLKECVDDRGSLMCRAKYRDDFKRIMKVLLQLITTNILAEESKSIRNTLNFDAIGNKCKSILYKYLTFDTEQNALRRSRDKALECMQKCVPGVPPDVLEHLLDVFYIAMVMDEDKILELHSQGVLKQCSDKQGRDQVRFYNAPSYINCGPGGILVRRERNIEKKYDTSVFLQNIITENTPFLKPLQKIKRASSTDCTTEDYAQYFDRLQVCRQKRLRLKFGKKRNKCKLNDLKHSWTAMVDCMIEDIGGELSCHVTTEEQMAEFLHFVSRTLHSSLQNTDDSCPFQPNCYGSEAPALFTCSALYLQLLKANEATVPIKDVLDGSSDVLECLNPIWPDCFLEVQFSSLQFLYLPLGLNYDNSISQGLTFVSCEETTVQSHENSSFPHCMDNEDGNEFEDDNSFSSMETCINCVKKKEGICISSNDRDLANQLEGEFSRISRCLKNFISDDYCLKDMTTRIQDKCLPEFYRLYKNIAKGIVLNSIEYFRKFNECLVDFKSDCPINYKKFALHLYYDVLGLSSIFEPEFSYGED